jgi:hypothetical protein
MFSLRAFFRDHFGLSALVIALALAMKILVPAGYMPGEQAKTFTVQICADAQGQHLTQQIAIPMKGDSNDSQGKHVGGDGVCSFTALAMGSLSGADVVLLAIALAFILATGFTPATPPRLERIFHIRPPLRGPPASA